MFMIMALYASSIMASDIKRPDYFVIFTPIKYLDELPIIYLILCALIVNYLVDFSQQTWKCLFYESLYKQRPFK